MRRSSPDFGRKTTSGATGGAMRKALRRSATAIVALTLAAALGCAGASSSPQQAARAPRPSPEASVSPSSIRVTDAAFNEDADGARLVLSADAPLLYTSYEPRPDLLVVDLPA